MDNYILIVDDDPDARQILIKIVEGLGLPTKIAPDGKAALAVIAEEQPALILLDLMMPGMDGFQVLSHLQGIPKYRHIPVIVVSAVSYGHMLKLPGVALVIEKARFRARQLQEFVTTTLRLDIVSQDQEVIQ